MAHFPGSNKCFTLDYCAKRFQGIHDGNQGSRDARAEIKNVEQKRTQDPRNLEADDFMYRRQHWSRISFGSVSYTHLRAHETGAYL
eukprot:4111628-Pyramimonas_sp.AAC.1